MENKPFLSLLSMCAKASRLEFGYDKAKQAALRGDARLILISSDISPGVKKRLCLLSRDGIPEITEIPMTMDEIWSTAGRRAGVIAITDKGFADRLRELAGQLVRGNSTR